MFSQERRKSLKSSSVWSRVPVEPPGYEVALLIHQGCRNGAFVMDPKSPWLSIDVYEGFHKWRYPKIDGF